MMAQWERTDLTMQDTPVWSLVQEDSSCGGTSKPVLHNDWACALEPGNHPTMQLLKHACPRAQAQQQDKPAQWELAHRS